MIHLFAVLFLTVGSVHAQTPPGEDGYDLWLRYEPVKRLSVAEAWRSISGSVYVGDDSSVMQAAAAELARGVSGLIGAEPAPAAEAGPRTVLLVTRSSPELPDDDALRSDLDAAGLEGYVLRSIDTGDAPMVVIASISDVGVLYGTFHLLRLIAIGARPDDLDVVSTPRVRHRLLNHWDNLDRTVERGYAGFSLWDWHKLPDWTSPRYTDYARANASIGINGTVLTNVNANAEVLTVPYIEKAAALADVFRPYGIRVYLTARFTAPVEIGGLDTADPLDPDVAAWWVDRADMIYERIPDFGGFLVKANSEGQPGPQDYGRSHADGANMLADAVVPHGGIVMWRAFVYSFDESEDRAKQAYDEFTPLDSAFRDNVLVQVKNGPIDFQPREPFHPLFGAMPGTPLVMEFQITKEYLGQATHLAYLAPMWTEVLGADTYAQGAGSTVAEVVDGSLHDYDVTGIAGVSNVGTDRNWTGSHFDQANWYAFGRLAWNPDLSAGRIADEWIRQTFSRDEFVVQRIRHMMMISRQAVVDYMTPLGLHHLMATGHHYGPGPWVDDLPRGDWNPVYYHRADSIGVGFDRTERGSNAVSQYHRPLRQRFADVESVPEKYLLWFHHVPWDYETESGRTLWHELVRRYNRGVDSVRAMQEDWARLEGVIDPRRHEEVSAFLEIQLNEAVWWRDASLSYFQQFARRPIPEGYPEPAHDLSYYEALQFPYAPGH